MSTSSCIVDKRTEKILEQVQEAFKINLCEREVLTEAATGYYQYNALLTALTKPEKVYVVCQDSRFGTRDNAYARLRALSKYYGVADKIEYIDKITPDVLSRVDIATNTGFVRPFTKDRISQLKSTAVIPLMWECWEYREHDFDLAACREHNILVLGTDESIAPLSMDDYAGVLAIHLIFALRLELYKTRVLLLGADKLTYRIANYFDRIGTDYTWYSPSGHNGNHYNQLNNFIENKAAEYDCVIAADLMYDKELIGCSGVLNPCILQRVNPAIKIGVIGGDVNYLDVENAEIDVFPKTIVPKHMMNYQLYEVGPKPIIELFAGGLLVADKMSEARLLKGMDLISSIDYSLNNAPAMDFDGKWSWRKYLAEKSAENCEEVC